MNYTIHESALSKIADAIRKKTTEQYRIPVMLIAEKIAEIPYDNVLELTVLNPSEVKTQYDIGDSPAVSNVILGMKYESGLELYCDDISKITYEPNRPLTGEDKAITFYYTENNKTVSCELPISVKKETLDSYPTQIFPLTYNGSTQNANWNWSAESDNWNKVTVSGIERAENAGTYTTIFTPNAGIYWPDETREAKAVEWVIEPLAIVVPTQNGTLTYNGTEQTVSWNNLDRTTMSSISGPESATNAGDYYVTFTTNENHKFQDESN